MYHYLYVYILNHGCAKDIKLCHAFCNSKIKITNINYIETVDYAECLKDQSRT